MSHLVEEVAILTESTTRAEDYEVRCFAGAFERPDCFELSRNICRIIQKIPTDRQAGLGFRISVCSCLLQ